jgi:hypothetical protein
MADFNSGEWFAEITKGVDLPADQAEVLKAVLAREDLSANVGKSVSRQSDYSRNMDQLSTQKAELDRKIAAASESVEQGKMFVERNKDRDHNNMDIHEDLTNKLAEANRRLEDAGEERVKAPAAPAQPKFDESKFVTKDDIAAMRQDADKNAIAYANRVNSLGNKYHADFGKYLDADKLVDHATQKGITLDAAFSDLYADDYATKSETDIQARIDKAVDDKETELRSTLDFPENAGPQRVSGLDIPEEDRLKSEGSRVAAAVQGSRDFASGKKEIPSWVKG